MTKLEQAARQALEALSDCVDDSRTVLSQNEQIYTERYRPHVLIEQERVVKDAETAIAALHEALSGVQALSAAPAEALGYFSFSDECDFDRHDTAEAAKAAATEMLSEIRRELGGEEWPMDVESICWGVVVERATEHDQTTGEDGEKYCDYVLKGASPTPPVEQAAPKAEPGVGNSGFDYKTAADFLNGKTVSDEAVRKFVATSRWAHDERAALSATLLAMHGVLTSREAEIALLKKALLEAETAPQPAPAPLSDDAKDAARYRLLRRGRHWSVIDGIGNDLLRAEALDAAIDAALAAQGGK